MSLRKQLVKTFQGGAVVRFASLGSTILCSMALARALGPDEFGIYSYVFAIITLLALPSQVGIPTLLIRETAKAHAKSDWAALKGLWYWATSVIFTTSVLIIVIATISIMLGVKIQPQGDVWVIIFGLLLVPIIALGSARGAALQGLRHVVLGLTPDSVFRPMALSVFIIVVWGMHGSVTASQAMGLHVIAAFLAFVIGAYFLYKAGPIQLIGVKPDRSKEKLWWRAVFPLAIVSGLQVVSNQIGILILGIYSTAPDVAFYKVATSAATMSIVGLQIVNMVMGPHIAKLHALGDSGSVQRFASISAIFCVATIAPMFLGFALYGQEIITIIYGLSYIRSYEPLIILVAGQVINAAYGIVGLLLGMTGYENQAARWLAVSTGVNVFFSFLLIPKFGSIGAALASALSLILWNVFFWMVARKEIGVDSSIFYAIANFRTVLRLK